MHRLSRLAAGLVLAAGAAAAHAQGTINSGSTFLQFVGTPMGTSLGNANLLFGSTSAFATDNLYRYGWSYNQGPATSNRPFSSLDTPVATYVGNTATFSWSNAGAGTTGFARWDATMVVTLTEISPTPGGSEAGAARVDTQLTFKASSGNAGSIAFNLFHDLDFDVKGTSGAGGDTFRVLDNTAVLGRATDATSANYAEFIGAGASRYEFNSGSALRTKLGAVSSGAGTGTLNTLAGVSASDWASTDGALAFQWARTLAPGESTVILSSFTINSPVPEPASALLMLGGGALLLAARRRRQG
jgi:hypothetical protein